jgi:hypothetical protein
MCDELCNMIKCSVVVASLAIVIAIFVHEISDKKHMPEEEHESDND